jgi:hypothetical protein
MFKLVPDPGVLPTKPAPRNGEKVLLRLDGLPPYKELRASIRNPQHRYYSRFVSLRQAAIKAMDGRAWSNGAVTLSLFVHAPNFDKNKTLVDYLGGVFDTLDGSHGYHFTYLPICFQDDCQVSSGRTRFLPSPETFYEIEIQFDSDDDLGIAAS